MLIPLSLSHQTPLLASGPPVVRSELDAADPAAAPRLCTPLSLRRPPRFRHSAPRRRRRRRCHALRGAPAPRRGSAGPSDPPLLTLLRIASFVASSAKRVLGDFSV
jgi:hypothetical protein